MTWGGAAWGTAAWGTPGRAFYPRTAADSAPATDVVTAVHRPLIVRTASDSAPATDVATRQTTYRRVAEDLGARPQPRLYPTLVSRPVSPVFATRTPGLTDAASGRVTFARTAADTVPTPVDAATRRVTYVRTVSDSAPASDSTAVRLIIVRRSAGETLVVPTDAATRRVVFPRGPPDSAPTSDGAVRVVSARRSAADAAPASDAALRQEASLQRGAADEAPAIDFVVHEHRRKQFRQGLDLLPVPVDEVVSPAHRTRTAVEYLTQPLPDDGTRTVVLRRSAADEAPATDGTVRQSLHRRKASDGQDPPRDVVRRSVLLRRSASDTAPVTDQVNLLLGRTAADVVPVPADSAARVAYKPRAAFDLLRTSIEVHRSVVLRRSGTDTAAATDASAGTRIRLRSASDAAPASDAATRYAVTGRVGHDAAPVVDSAIRWKRALRSPQEILPTPTDEVLSRALHSRLGIDTLPWPVDEAARAMLLARLAFDWVRTPTDGVHWTSRRVPVPGPPVATVTSVSSVKASLNGDCDADEVRITFTFDQPVSAWEVRVNSTSERDGSRAASWYTRDVGFGRQPFGQAPFGRAKLGDLFTEGSATIDARLLRHGKNLVVVYGRAPTRQWSFHPVGQIAAEAEGSRPVGDLVPAR